MYVFSISAAGIKISDYIEAPKADGQKVDELLAYMLEHYKILVLLSIPISSCITYLFFIKAKQNFAEHLVLNTYKAGGDLLINLLFLFLIPIFRSIPYVLIVYPVITVLYGIWFYRQYFAKDYRSRFALNMLSTYAHTLSQGLSGIVLIPYFLEHSGLLKK